MRVALALAASLAVAGCGVTDPNEGARIELRTDAPAYHSDATVKVAIRNVGTRDVLYTGCPFALEARNGSRWVEMGWPQRPIVCTAQAPARVRPGETGQLGTRLPNLPTGRYRLVFGGIWAEAGIELAYEQRATNMFQIGFMLD